MKILLYTVPTANGQRASIALEECGIEYAVRPIDLYAGEHRSDEMLAINPMGRLPLIAIDNANTTRHIYGSLAIGTWAAQRAGLLLPDGDLLEEYHQWMGIVMTDLAPAFASHFYLDVLAETPQTWGVAWFSGILRHILGVLDRRLESHEYVLGSDYSLVDTMLYPAAASSMPRIAEQLPEFPHLRRWQELVSHRPAVQKGMNPLN